MEGMSSVKQDVWFGWIVKNFDSKSVDQPQINMEGRVN